MNTTTRTATRCDRIIDLIDDCLATCETSPRLVAVEHVRSPFRPAPSTSSPTNELRLVASR